MKVLASDKKCFGKTSFLLVFQWIMVQNNYTDKSVNKTNTECKLTEAQHTHTYTHTHNAAHDIIVTEHVFSVLNWSSETL